VISAPVVPTATIDCSDTLAQDHGPKVTNWRVDSTTRPNGPADRATVTDGDGQRLKPPVDHGVRRQRQPSFAAMRRSEKPPRIKA